MANWTREQVLIALNLYCQIPFGKLHHRNPQIIAMAERLGRTPSALAMKLTNLASLDPAITASGRKGLEGASALDREVWNAFQEDPESIGWESQQLVDTYTQGEQTLSPLHSEPIAPAPEIDYSGAETKAVQTIRLKQSFFRKAVLSSYQSRCCMSGIRSPKLLIASHIVPWAVDAKNRLNPSNGLCLSALHDRAFDQGLITVTPDHVILVSEQLRSEEDSPIALGALINLHGKHITLPEKFQPSTNFLLWHNSNIFSI